MNNFKKAVDDLGKLLAEIADLEIKAKALKEKLKAGGESEYEGELFRATISESERHTLDMKAVRGKLSSQFITAHTNITPVTTIKVVARTGDIAA